MFKTEPIGGFLTPLNMSDNPRATSYPDQIKDAIIEANAKGLMVKPDGSTVKIDQKTMDKFSAEFDEHPYLKAKNASAASNDAQQQIQARGESDPMEILKRISSGEYTYEPEEEVEKEGEDADETSS